MIFLSLFTGCSSASDGAKLPISDHIYNVFFNSFVSNCYTTKLLSTGNVVNSVWYGPKIWVFEQTFNFFHCIATLGMVAHNMTGITRVPLKIHN